MTRKEFVSYLNAAFWRNSMIAGALVLGIALYAAIHEGR